MNRRGFLGALGAALATVALSTRLAETTLKAVDVLPNDCWYLMRNTGNDVECTVWILCDGKPPQFVARERLPMSPDWHGVYGTAGA